MIHGRSGVCKTTSQEERSGEFRAQGGIVDVGTDG